MKLKNINTNEEYEVTGSINLLIDEELKTNYTIVIDGFTTTITLPSEEYELVN